MMVFVICALTVLGVLTGIFTLIKSNRIEGILRIVLAVVCPIITVLFCSLKSSRAFGGTDWQFIVHSATIDADPAPWIIFLLFVLEVIFIARYFLFRIKNSQEER